METGVEERAVAQAGVRVALDDAVKVELAARLAAPAHPPAVLTRLVHAELSQLGPAGGLELLHHVLLHHRLGVEQGQDLEREGWGGVEKLLYSRLYIYDRRTK